MPAIVLVGAQWGDEGKGKATDLMGGDVDRESAAKQIATNYLKMIEVYDSASS